VFTAATTLQHYTHIPHAHNAQPFRLLVLIDQNFLRPSRDCSVILSVTYRRITAVFDTIKEEESFLLWQLTGYNVTTVWGGGGGGENSPPFKNEKKTKPTNKFPNFFF